MTFCKLDSGIVKSSIWSSPLETRILWITMLAIKDENGFVECSRSGLIRLANIPADKFDSAIIELESPDPDSKSQEFDGRRIDKIDGGWIVLNHEKYRTPESEKKASRNEYMREYMRKKREKQYVKPNIKLTPVNSELTSVSVSNYVSNSVSDDKKNQPEQKYSMGFLMFWKAYPRRIGKGAAYKAWNKVNKEAEKIMEGVRLFSELCIKKRTEEKYIPHPSTWLNERRWEDEYDQNHPTTKSTTQKTDQLDCGSLQLRIKNNWPGFIDYDYWPDTMDEKRWRVVERLMFDENYRLLNGYRERVINYLENNVEPN